MESFYLFLLDYPAIVVGIAILGAASALALVIAATAPSPRPPVSSPPSHVKVVKPTRVYDWEIDGG